MKTIMLMAESLNQVIGDNNSIPWSCPEDMKHFRETTTGHCVIMGRKTFESIGSRPLKNRHNIVISGSWLTDRDDVLVVPNIYGAHQAGMIECARKGCHCFVIGGAQIYQQFLDADLVDEIYVSVIDVTCSGDTLAPTIPSQFICYENIEFNTFSLCKYFRH